MSVTLSLLRAVAPLAFLSWLTLAPRDARSQTPPAAPPPSPPGETGASETVSPPSAEPDKKKKKKDKEAEAAAAAAGGATGVAFATSDGGRTTKLLDGRLELKGRVFGRAMYTKSRTGIGGINNNEGLDFNVASARFGIKYEVLDFASMVVEADVGDQPLLRDAFVQARSKRLRGRFGQFKMPISSITLDSPWSLPIARRGNLQTVLAERLFLAGRRPGASFAARGGGWLDPELTVGIFQGAFLQPDFDEDFFKLQGLDRHNLVARLSATPSGVDVGLVATRTTVQANNRIGHFWAVGPDATFEIPFTGSALRGWFEAFLGNMEHSRAAPPGGPSPFEYYKSNFWFGRMIAAWRLGGTEEGEWFVEPYVLAGGFDPDTTAGTDLFMEAFVGVNTGWWRRLRVTLQYEMASAGDLMPEGIFPGNLVPQSHNVLLLQVGAAF